MYKRYLTSSSSYYYHIYSIVVPVSGYYSIMTLGANDSYGYIYKPSFNSSDPSTNLIAYDDNSGGNQQFQIIMHLEANTQYNLVLTTASRNQTGPYTIIVSGLNTVNINRIYEYDTVTTTSPNTDNTQQTVIIAVSVAIGSVLIIVVVVFILQHL